MKVDDSQPTPDSSSYIGRAAIDSTYKAGSTPVGNSLLHVVRDGKVLKFSEFEVLTSEYPSLQVSLRKFDFTEIDLTAVEGNAKYELFGVDEITTKFSDRTEVTLEREGIIDEYFDLVEDIADSWAAVYGVELNMILWCGSPAMKTWIQMEDYEIPNVFGFRVERERKVRISAKFELASGENSAQCSFAVIHEDLEIPFKATAIFRSGGNGQNKISQEEISNLLRVTGRDESTFVNLPDGSVQATVTGRLNGRWVLRTYLQSDDPDDPNLSGYGPCDRHLIRGGP